MEWHKEARRLRAEGWKLCDIGGRFGVTGERVRQVCRGIVCPVDHRDAVRINFSNPEWRERHLIRPAHKRNEREDFIRAHYKQDMTALEIGKALGVSRNAIIGSARDLGLCGDKNK